MYRRPPPSRHSITNGALRAATAGFVVATAILLSACEQEEDKPPQQPLPEQVILSPAGYENLPGWNMDRHAEALPALLRSCARFLKQPPAKPLGARIPGAIAADIQPACRAAQSLPAGHDLAARSFFEQWFQPWAVSDNDKADGLFTGYYEIELQGSVARDDIYTVPVYRKPPDHVTVDLGSFDPALSGRTVVGRVDDGKLKPYYARGDIQGGVLAGQGIELVWLKDPLDAFMLHVQGSGRVTLTDGRSTRIGYAANNGYPYKSIGRALIDRGELEAHAASWPNIRAWLHGNPARAAELLAVNQRYIFFGEITGDGPIGAQGVALTAGRSMAVDTRYIPLGLPLWLDTVMPGAGAGPLQRLMLAQDTGSAIKGPVRGDFFWGTGDGALEYAGRMKSQGRYYILLPKVLANRLASG
ncbi:MAG: murein transglycosylase A [Proteobacteria bacterium]|nr:murein transglycosylase A [Pseudomonadota bacterium]